MQEKLEPKTQIYVNGKWIPSPITLDLGKGRVQIVNTGDGEVFARSNEPVFHETASVSPISE